MSTREDLKGTEQGNGPEAHIGRRLSAAELDQVTGGKGGGGGGGGGGHDHHDHHDHHHHDHH